MKRITENRTISYIIITIIYILATFVGVLTYNALDFEWWINLLVADGRQSSKPGFDDYRSETRMLLPIKRFK